LKLTAGVCGCGTADADSDGDGTADCHDSCPNDPLKLTAGVCGCGIADVDSDGDGTADCHDSCPSDPKKFSAGLCGCGIADTDSDGDGTADCEDSCPTDPLKLTAGVCGCGVADTDSDGDGSPDCHDGCPSDPLKLEAGACGCGTADVDSDGDGTPDCHDSCPDDPSKLVAGVCGCGISDVDSDGDHTADCQDHCPNDPLKLTAGACGCGLPDTDSDKDGIADCLDLCPTDSRKSSPGACGCGNADTDSDHDGVADCRDTCPLDAHKSSPGVCGCGVTDNDSDGDGRLDCQDACPYDSRKTAPGTCGCGTADEDRNGDGVTDCICSGVCDSKNPFRDDDGDGVSNCDEIADGTAVCDAGSFLPEILPTACVGANGFFAQTNIISVVNHLSRALSVSIEYRDSNGAVRGTTHLSLQPFLKQDISVNDLGLQPDTQGTVCVSTDAPTRGGWHGGLAIYKPRFNADGSAGAAFDYALYYPFENPSRGKTSIPLNTNSIGAAPASFVANWIRLSDSIAGDGQGLHGTLRYYSAGGVISSQRVDLADGGAQDYDGHSPLGQAGKGLAEFIPDSSTQLYNVQTTRYYYDGGFTPYQNFQTAFAIPKRPTTGVGISGRISNLPNEVSVVEMVNGSDAAASVALRSFAPNGTQMANENIALAGHDAFHRVVSAAMCPPNAVGSASVDGPREAIGAITVIYHFNSAGALDYAYAPPFIESPGSLQFTDFNTFIGHSDALEISNTSAQTISASVRVVDYANNGFTFSVNLAAHATSTTNLPPPLDSYGTIIVDSGSAKGLVVRNDISRPGQYVIPISSR
jgi:hypothetical protein